MCYIIKNSKGVDLLKADEIYYNDDTAYSFFICFTGKDLNPKKIIEESAVSVIVNKQGNLIYSKVERLY